MQLASRSLPTVDLCDLEINHCLISPDVHDFQNNLTSTIIDTAKRTIPTTKPCSKDSHRLSLLQGFPLWTTEIITDKFDVLRGRLLGNHNDFHWQLGGQINHQPCSYKAARVTRCTELDSAVSRPRRTSNLSVKKHAFNRMKRTRNPLHIVIFKRARAKAKITLNEAKKSSWQNDCSSLSSNTKLGQVWSTLKRFNRQQTNTHIPMLH